MTMAKRKGKASGLTKITTTNQPKIERQVGPEELHDLEVQGLVHTYLDGPNAAKAPKAPAQAPAAPVINPSEQKGGGSE